MRRSLNWFEATMDRLIEIGKSIKRARNRVGVSQDELARSVGMSRVSISNIEGGKQKTSGGKLMDIAMALGVGLDELVGNEKHISTAPMSSLEEARARIAELEQVVLRQNEAIREQGRVLRDINLALRSWVRDA
jgi:transcriptional regulator with XRE-family HTH domain